MGEKIDIKSLTAKELGKRLTELGVEKYRARQIWRWLFGRGVRSFDEMTDLSDDLRKRLKVAFHITHPVMLDCKTSALDGTTKYLLKLEDGHTVETVYLPEEDRFTICLSSQVGCKYSCSFCASAPFGFKRNLTVAEILDEVIFVRAKHPASRITNLVFMGIGEPLDNYDHLLAAIRILNDKDGFNIGARKITISTCGIIPAIQKLEREDLQIELAVSLHAADDTLRSKLIPINTRYPLHDLMAACRQYVEATGRIITFEYILLKDVNTTVADARKLAALLAGLRCKVNTISYNQIRAKDYAAPLPQEVRVFMAALKAAGVNAIHRKSKGEDIDAGCGQLRIAKL